MVVALFLLLLAEVSVRQDQTPLRDACGPDGVVVATLPAGAPVTIRFAVAGGSANCYNIAAQGQAGYVSGEQLTGLETFERERVQASHSVESVKVTTVEVDSAWRRAAAAVTAHGPLAAAVKLIETNQPAAALASLEPALRRPPEPNVLLLAGVAAWHNDDPQHALQYWKAALDLRPDPALESLYRKVQRETAADRSGQKAIGMRVTLRYEADAVPPALAREMVDALDSEYSRIAAQLGCRADERLTAIVQSRESYRSSTGAAEWSGGQYDGRIRIALPEEKTIGPATRRVFAHELTHACLSSLGSWPAWFHEGLAQKLAGDQLPAAGREKLEALARAGTLPRLSALRQSWSHMNTEEAGVAYALALRAADLLVEGQQYYGIRDVLQDRARFERVAEELERKLARWF